MDKKNPSRAELEAELDERGAWASEDNQLNFYREMRRTNMEWARLYKSKHYKIPDEWVRFARRWHHLLMERKWRNR